MVSFGARFEQAKHRFILAHREDKRTHVVDGDAKPRAEFYHRQVVRWLERLRPDGSEALMLAGHCQHIRRWVIPRTDFPEGSVGYKRWRSTLARFHGEQAAEVLAEVGYDPSVIRRVQDLLLKKKLGSDPEAQALEDAVCLTFLEFELAEFARRHTPEQVIDILRKTWAKMGAGGRKEAVDLLPTMDFEVRTLVEAAVAE